MCITPQSPVSLPFHRYRLRCTGPLSEHKEAVRFLSAQRWSVVAIRAETTRMADPALAVTFISKLQSGKMNGLHPEIYILFFRQLLSSILHAKKCPLFQPLRIYMLSNVFFFLLTHFNLALQQFIKIKTQNSNLWNTLLVASLQYLKCLKMIACPPTHRKKSEEILRLVQNCVVK